MTQSLRSMISEAYLRALIETVRTISIKNDPHLAINNNQAKSMDDYIDDIKRCLRKKIRNDISSGIKEEFLDTAYEHKDAKHSWLKRNVIVSFDYVLHVCVIFKVEQTKQLKFYDMDNIFDYLQDIILGTSNDIICTKELTKMYRFMLHYLREYISMFILSNDVSWLIIDYVC